MSWLLVTCAAVGGLMVGEAVDATWDLASVPPRHPETPHTVDDVTLLRNRADSRSLLLSEPTPTPTLTPPEPTPTPAPAPADPAGVVCSYPWPQGCGYALAVVSCESSFREWVDTNEPYVGWWQIDVDLHAGLIASMGYTREDMYYGVPNTAVAWRLSREGRDMSPWPSCRRR